MADDLFYIRGELRVHDRLVAELFGTRLGQRDGFGNRAARRSDGAKHRYRLSAGLDHGLHPRADMRSR